LAAVSRLDLKDSLQNVGRAGMFEIEKTGRLAGLVAVSVARCAVSFQCQVANQNRGVENGRNGVWQRLLEAFAA